MDMIPEPTLRRLPWYLAYVTMLHSQGVEYVSSTNMAGNLDVDSSQIAKDLSYLDIRGKTRIGYEVKGLEEQLARFLGFMQRHNAVVVGAGSLGSALMSDSGLGRYGLNIVAGFDSDPSKTGAKIAGTPVFGLDRLSEILESLNVKVAIITVPFDFAQDAADTCMDAGISGIWNFTPRRLRVRAGVVIQNTSIYSDLAVMYNRLDSLKNEK